MERRTGRKRRLRLGQGECGWRKGGRGGREEDEVGNNLQEGEGGDLGSWWHEGAGSRRKRKRMRVKRKRRMRRGK